MVILPEVLSSERGSAKPQAGGMLRREGGGVLSRERGELEMRLNMFMNTGKVHLRIIC